jgi:phospholipid/cholesterol/gamma-HCH transport system ATP-binding protein
MIELTDIKKSFGEKEVLKGVTLTVPTGSTTCVIGKSGSGKSVLLKHIVGLLQQDAGTVLIDGKNVDTISRDELFALRRRIGYVFQGAALFDSLTVFDNVVISLVEHGERDAKLLESEARRVLSSVGLIPDLTEEGSAHFESEYQILRSKKPSSLSGGMRKRVGVARALVGDPDYIFYDEPTTGLDPVTSQQIDDLIGDLASKLNVTSLVITHDMFSIFNIADHVAMLEDGVVRFQGDIPKLRSCTDDVVVDFLARYVAEGF